MRTDDSTTVRVLSSLLTAVLALACGETTTGTAASSAGPNAPAPPPAHTTNASGDKRRAPTATPPVKLDSNPDIDLLANAALWHQYRGDALVIQATTAGFYKYTQEYSKPWGDVVPVAGRQGRLVRARAATLRIPWHATGEATLVVDAHGAAAGQRASVFVNDKRVGDLSLPASWSNTSLAIPASALSPGENEVRLFFARRGRAGGSNAYAVIRSLEVAPGRLEAADSRPEILPSPVRSLESGGVTRATLAGDTTLVLYTEIPPEAWLDVHLGANAKSAFRVTARTFDGAPQSILDETIASGWHHRSVSLAELAGRLVRLELSIDGDDPAAAGWGAPRIALAKAKVRPRPKPYENLILVVIDALRADRLTPYGKTRVRTPRMTGESAERGVVFLNNQAASPSSPPSHGSIQTGMIPRVHGVVGDKADLTPGTPMVSTQLGAAGIATAYYGNNPFGMGRLERPGKWTEFHQPTKEGLGIDCTALVKAMLDFAKRQSDAGKRFFISSLPYEPHTPYRYHEGITEHYYDGPFGPPVGKSVDGVLLGGLSAGKVKLTDQQWKQLEGLYDGEVEHMDGCFGILVDELERLGLADSTAIIVTSDHGEGMFEHGKMGHAFGHYAELANIPLIVYADRLVETERKIETVTSHLDITPTILDLMGVKIDDRVQGESLVPLMLRQGPWTPRVMPLEYGRSYALRARRWKYIVDYQQNESLFDLVTDPTEQTPLEGSADHAMPLRYMRDLAGQFLAKRSGWKMAVHGALNNHR